MCVLLGVLISFIANFVKRLSSMYCWIIMISFANLFLNDSFYYLLLFYYYLIIILFDTHNFRHGRYEWQNVYSTLHSICRFREGNFMWKTLNVMGNLYCRYWFIANTTEVQIVKGLLFGFLRENVFGVVRCCKPSD